MFKTKHSTQQIKIKKIEEILTPYMLLKEDIEEGFACRFKFTNDYKGIPQEKIDLLKALSNAIIEKDTSVLNKEVFRSYKDKYTVIDALVIFSNHLDQQKEVVGGHPQLDRSVKNKFVYRWLQAAFLLGTHHGTKDIYQFSDSYSSRELSSLAQMLFYYGKAMRYNDEPVEERLEMLNLALKMAQHLADTVVDKDKDPHAYQTRINTFELPIMYCLMDLNQFDKALKIAHSQVEQINEKESPFHKIHAYCKVCEVYTRQSKELRIPLNNEAIKAAEEAIKVSLATKVLPFIGERALMNAYLQAGNLGEARQLAQIIVDAPKGDVKDFITKEAIELLENNPEEALFQCH